MPLNTTEKEGFQYFCSIATPHFTLPGRSTVTKLMDEKYEVLSTILKSKLGRVECFSFDHRCVDRQDEYQKIFRCNTALCN
jgi:hypothetical protein